MFGAIAGDVIGSAYEWHNVKQTDFELFTGRTDFTDDTVLTIAVADALLYALEPGGQGVESLKEAYAARFMLYGHRYPNAGYGGRFSCWLGKGAAKPYNSYGNGSAMRVSPIGFVFCTLEETLREARRSSIVTHNHPEGIKGAQATAAAIYLARMGESKQAIKEYVEREFHYNLHRSLDDIRPGYTFDESCQGTVPEAITAFLESDDFEDAIRKAISLGGDSDTLACITGGIAQAYYGKIPDKIYNGVIFRLDASLKTVLNRFNERFGIKLLID